MDPSPAQPEPSRRLPPRIRTLWRLEAAARWGGVAIAVLVLRDAVGDDLPSPLPTLLWVVPLLGVLLELSVIPELRWRRWRYEVRDQEIDLRHGTFTLTRTLVPMARVQHVDTRQGLLEQALHLTGVVFHTAAGATAIPGLLEAEALEVRDRIATLARAPDEL
jgi:uncharacterized protein